MVTTSRVVRYMAMQIRTWEKWTSTSSRSRYHRARLEWNSLVQDTLKWGHLSKQDTFTCTCSCPKHPLCVHYKHWNQDTSLIGSISSILRVSGLERFHCNQDNHDDSYYPIHPLCVHYTTPERRTPCDHLYWIGHFCLSRELLTLKRLHWNSESHHIFTFHLSTMYHYTCRRMCVVGVV